MDISLFSRRSTIQSSQPWSIMIDKNEIAEAMRPIAVLKAMNSSTEQAVSCMQLVNGMVPVRSFPFRVGRESRVKIVDGRVERIERVKESLNTPNNDLYLVDKGHLLNVSREHFQIERLDGKYYLYDRDSTCGTFVGETGVGSGYGDNSIELNDGDLITLGTKNSPYIFQFVLLEE